MKVPTVAQAAVMRYLSLAVHTVAAATASSLAALRLAAVLAAGGRVVGLATDKPDDARSEVLAPSVIFRTRATAVQSSFVNNHTVCTQEPFKTIKYSMNISQGDKQVSRPP
eukprot:6205519-Pleurochrysis_carterae.AAC.1